MNTNIFGLPVKYEAWDKLNSLSFYLRENYYFQMAYINGKRCIIIEPQDELVTTPALKKHIARIQEKDNVPVILQLDSISPCRRNSLRENGISFITNKQAYLPFVGAMLMDEKETSKKIEKFVFSTQQLFLLYMYSQQEKYYISEATRELPFTAMTLSRAVKQLETTGLFRVTKDGVNKVIESKYNRLELFEKAKKYLSTPVRKSGYIDKSKITADMVIAGDTVLAEKTVLNPDRLITYAVYGKTFDKKELADELVDPDKQVRLELWAYDPKQFSEEEEADSLSVALSLLENTDERVEGAVEELIESELVG